MSKKKPPETIEQIRIGQYRLSIHGRWVWILNKDDEGMEVTIEKLELCLHEFWRKEF